MNFIDKTKEIIVSKEKITENDIIDVANLYINNQGLNKYVTDISLKRAPQKNNDFGQYYDDGTIIIYPNNIRNDINPKINNFEQIYKVVIFSTLYHELTHAKQKKLADLEPGFVGDLFRDDIQFFQKSQLRYNLHYGNMIGEYNANMESSIIMLLVNKKLLDKTINNPFAYFAIKYYGLNYPLRNHMRITNLKIDIPEMDLYNKLIHGIKLTKEEKEKVSSILLDDVKELKKI